MISFQFLRGIDDVRDKKTWIPSFRAMLMFVSNFCSKISENLCLTCKDQRNPWPVFFECVSNQCQ